MKTIGIIGFGTVGRAIQHGFQQVTDFRIHDNNPLISENTLDEVVNDSDYIFICVPTPTSVETGKCDISILDSVLNNIRKIGNYSHIIERKFYEKIYIIKSTITPNTTIDLQNKYSMRLVFNPEFLTERSYKLDFINTSRIILGGHQKDTSKVKELYEERFPKGSVPIYETDSTTAETVKCLANCFLAIKVLLCNEFYDICKELCLDYNEVINLVLADGRIGRSHTDVPGHDGKRGVGGLCFPKDLCATIKKAEELGINPMIMKAAWKKNLEVRKEKDWEKIKGAVSN